MKKYDLTKLSTPGNAENLAAEMQVDDPNWTYIARHDPMGEGYSLIEVFDEDGELVNSLFCQPQKEN